MFTPLIEIFFKDFRNSIPFHILHKELLVSCRGCVFSWHVIPLVLCFWTSLRNPRTQSFLLASASFDGFSILLWTTKCIKRVCHFKKIYSNSFRLYMYALLICIRWNIYRNWLWLLTRKVFTQPFSLHLNILGMFECILVICILSIKWVALNRPQILQLLRAW